MPSCPGVSINLAILAVGAAVTVALVLVCAALAACQAARQDGGLAVARIADVGQRPSRLTRAVAAIGLRPTIVTGMRLALEPGRGRTAVPVRAATAGAAAAVCALLMVGTFAASLTRLTTSPAGYGVTWDVSVGIRPAPGRWTAPGQRGYLAVTISVPLGIALSACRSGEVKGTAGFGVFRR